MLGSSIFRTVDFCTRRAWWVIVFALALAAVSTVYATRHFAIKTDVTDLFPPDLPWTQRAFEYMKELPQPDILVVVDAPTPESADEGCEEFAGDEPAWVKDRRSDNEPETGRPRYSRRTAFQDQMV